MERAPGPGVGTGAQILRDRSGTGANDSEAALMKSETEAVLAQIDRDQDYLIDLTRRLVRIPTVNPKFEADPVP